MVWAALAQGVDPFSEAATEFLTDKTTAVLRESVHGLPWQVSYMQRISSTSEAFGSFRFRLRTEMVGDDQKRVNYIIDKSG